MELKRKKLEMPEGGWRNEAHFESTIDGSLKNWMKARIILDHATADLWLVGKTTQYDVRSSDGNMEGDIAFDGSVFSVDSFLGHNSIGFKTWRKYSRIAFGMTPHERHKAARMDEYREQIAQAAIKVAQPGFSQRITAALVADGNQMSTEYRIVFYFENGKTKEMNWDGLVARTAVQAETR